MVRPPMVFVVDHPSYKGAAQPSDDRGDAARSDIAAWGGVDAMLVHPQDDQYLQPACRWDGAGSQYRMGVRPETGEVWVNRWLPSSGSLPYTSLFEAISTAVHPGTEVNHLELACKGATIQVSVNGTTLASISDNTIQAGQLWIAAGELRGGGHPDVGTEAHFENISVVQD